MASRETWGLRLFLAGFALGIGLMAFVVAFVATSSYQGLVNASYAGTVPAAGLILEGGALLAFALSVAGIACFPSTAATSAVTSTPKVPMRGASARASRRERSGKVRRPRPSTPQGST